MTAMPNTTMGVFILSLSDSGYNHLFAYSPESLSLTRITADPWDDITPAFSPDGNWVAFSSRRNGYWDLYVLDLHVGTLVRMTDTLEYDGAPCWSPDGAWLTYESYVAGSLKIFIRSVTDTTQAPIQLTSGSSSDHSPVWSPQGRQIAFISDRSGEPDVWIADTQVPEEQRFHNISANLRQIESHPAWSPDGNQLAWAATDPTSGLSGIYVWDARDPNTPARWVGSGDWPTWQDDTHIATQLPAPLQTYLTGYLITGGVVSLPPVMLPGSLHGFTFKSVSLSLPGPFQAAAQITPAALYSQSVNSSAELPGGRSSLVNLDNVQAPYPQLSELASDSFQTLRARVSAITGWDPLSNLENAYVPLSTPLSPGMSGDWLYTGRAFAINPVLIQAGWMAIVREDFGQQTYWRVYLRATAQDGSAGIPLSQSPWDFFARIGDTSAYESGGRLMKSVPPGYWIDLTDLAEQYGWTRLPALTDWRTYYSGARFNEFVFTQNLDWQTAMLQLYPPEALLTPTVVIPPTHTPTRTLLFYRTETPTASWTPRPTFTP
jgi:TolB protein